MADYQEEILNELRRIGNEISSLNRKMDNFVPAATSPAERDPDEERWESAAAAEPEEEREIVKFCINCGQQITVDKTYCDDCERFRSFPVDEEKPVADTPAADTPADDIRAEDVTAPLVRKPEGLTLISDEPPPEIHGEEPVEEPASPPDEIVAGEGEADTEESEDRELVPMALFTAIEELCYRSLAEVGEQKSDTAETAVPSEEPQPDIASDRFDKFQCNFRDQEPKQETKKETEPARKPIRESAPEPVAARIPAFKETDIGMKWFGLAGIVLVVTAFAFFVKLAIDNEWIGPTSRVAGGVVLGLAFVIAGKWFDTRNQYKGYARTLIGGGFAILYLIIYAAHHLYGAEIGISKTTDIILLTVVVGAAIVFSIRMDAMVLAAEAFLLGYATAYMVGEIDEHTLYYNIVLAGGLIFLVYRKGWLGIGCAGLAATYVFHFIWMGQTPDQPFTSLALLFIYFVLFVALGIARQKFLAREDPETAGADMALPPETRIIFYCVAGLSLAAPFLGISSIPASGVGTFLVYYVMLDVALIVLSLKFSLPWTSLAATAAGYLAFSALYSSGNEISSGTAAGFLVLSYVIFSAYPFIRGGKDKEAIFEPSLILLFNTFFFFGLLFSKIITDYRAWAGAFTLSLAVMSLAQCALASRKDLRHLFKLHMVFTVVFVTLAVPVQLTKQWLPVSWAAESFALLYVSFLLKDELLKRLSQLVAVIAAGAAMNYAGVPELRTVALLVSAVSFFASAGLYHRTRLKDGETPLAFFETMAYGTVGWMSVNALLWYLSPAPWFHSASLCLWGVILLAGVSFMRLHWLVQAPFLTHIFILLYSVSIIGDDRSHSLGVLAPLVAGYLASYLILRKAEFPGGFNILKRIAPVYSALSGLLLTILLALVFKGHMLSIAWGIEAVVLLVIGVGDKNRYVRYSGMGLLGMTLAKVTISDMASLDMGYRVVSFFGLGLIFLLASFLYYKYKDRIEELL